MNPQLYADLVVAFVFEKLSKDTQQFILSTMFRPAETASTRGAIASEGVSQDVMSMEVPTAVPTASRLPRAKPTPVREVPKLKKYKQNKLVPVHKSTRKHAATEAQRKEKTSSKEKGKVVDLDVEEGVEDIDIKGVDPYLSCPSISLCTREK